jgi:hypothetical protein
LLRFLGFAIASLLALGHESSPEKMRCPASGDCGENGAPARWRRSSGREASRSDFAYRGAAVPLFAYPDGQCRCAGAQSAAARLACARGNRARRIPPGDSRRDLSVYVRQRTEGVRRRPDTPYGDGRISGARSSFRRAAPRAGQPRAFARRESCGRG